MTRRREVNARTARRILTPRRPPLLGLLISLGSLAGMAAVFVLLQNRAAPEVISITPATALDDQYRPVEATDVFSPDDMFFVSVELRGYRPTMELVARWHYEGSFITDTPLDTEDTGDGYAGFALINDDPPWLVGNYTVEIIYQDTVLGRASFRVADD